MTRRLLASQTHEADIVRLRAATQELPQVAQDRRPDRPQTSAVLAQMLAQSFDRVLFSGRIHGLADPVGIPGTGRLLAAT